MKILLSAPISCCCYAVATQLGWTDKAEKHRSVPCESFLTHCKFPHSVQEIKYWIFKVKAEDKEERIVFYV